MLKKIATAAGVVLPCGRPFRISSRLAETVLPVSAGGPTSCRRVLSRR
ncbi:hypothetical protein NLX83_24045 [Allokutzneria sp. A3M-2-11 16]|nr:hypothetical protein [Allokutzneria sp. A3M-2-11 16]MCP3802347.1 hypothetical protein [Allokutzneria sp. A3M-2-11 16]